MKYDSAKNPIVVVLMHANGGAGKVTEYVFVASRYAPQFQTDLFGGM